MLRKVLVGILLAMGAQVGAKDPVLVAFLGDSLSEGLGVESEQAYPVLIGKALEAKGKKVQILNASISGSTSASAPDRMTKLVAKKPKLVLLALGANDALRGLDTKVMEENLGKAIAIAQKEKIQVVLAGIDIPSPYGPSYTAKFKQAFQNLKKKYRVRWIENLLEGVLGKSDLNQSDGLHPNIKGHQVLSKSITPVLEKML